VVALTSDNEVLRRSTMFIASRFLISPALRRSTMFIASRFLISPALRRSAMCLSGAVYMPLLTERDISSDVEL
jgi:hypothetical protein